jgi:hypothetical protein
MFRKRALDITLSVTVEEQLSDVTWVCSYVGYSLCSDERGHWSGPFGRSGGGSGHGETMGKEQIQQNSNAQFWTGSRHIMTIRVVSHKYGVRLRLGYF